MHLELIDVNLLSTTHAHGTHPDPGKPIVWMRGDTFYVAGEHEKKPIDFKFQRSFFPYGDRDGPAVNIKYKITDTSNLIVDRTLVDRVLEFGYFTDMRTNTGTGPSDTPQLNSHTQIIFAVQDDDIDEIIVDADEVGLAPNQRTRTDESAEGPRPIKVEIVPDSKLSYSWYTCCNSS